MHAFVIAFVCILLLFYVPSKLHIYVKYNLFWPCIMNSRVSVLASLFPVHIDLFWRIKIVYITNTSFYEGLCKVVYYNNILTTHGT